jgi:cytochrome c oxidase cbb3-type subunit 3
MLWLLLYTRRLLAKDKPAAAVVHRESPYTWARMWSRLNSFRPMSEERELLLDHNYDGIQELDNRLPRWWLYGFYVCILFAAAYLWRFHVSHAAPLSGQEFAMAMEKAAIEKEAYLKKAANSVDENTVTLLTAPADLSEGKSIFTANCAACHGADAQGQVGPNLTDDYWLHKGSVQEVFKTIKYGYPEKGMRSWKDDLSPAQIAKVAGFIKSLHGTHPANAKEPQGELWQDEGKVVADSTKATAVK